MVCEGQVRQRLKNLKLPLNIKTDEILPKQTSLTFDLAEMQIWIWGICWSGTLSTSGSLARSARPSSEDSLHRCIVGYFWFKTQWLWTDFTLELQLTPCIETKVLSLISTSSQRRRQGFGKAEAPYQHGSFQALQYQGWSVWNTSWCCHAEIDRSSRRWRTWWHCARGSPRHPFSLVVIRLFILRFIFRTLGAWKAKMSVERL